MTVIADSTVFIHLLIQAKKMDEIIMQKCITKMYITRIGYLELLSGASIKRKNDTRKFLSKYPVLEFGSNAALVSNNLCMKYQVNKKNSKDFLIAAIAISNNIPLFTENDKDYQYQNIKVIPYRIATNFWL